MRKKALRIAFILFSLIVCFQLIGLGEAFCNDSVLETNCQDCVLCVLHQMIETSHPEMMPALLTLGHNLLRDSALKIEEPSFSFFRPPISR